MYVRSELHKTNAACTSLYERVRANEKTGKQALIAICNELIKQVYEVIKNGNRYQPIYCPDFTQRLPHSGWPVPLGETI